MGRNLAFCLFALLSCQAIAQDWTDHVKPLDPPVSRPEAVAAPVSDPTTACLAQLRDDDRIQILSGKFVFDVTKGQPLQVLANTSKPTVKEKAALSFLASEGERCFDLGAEWRLKNFPLSIISLMNTYRVEMVWALADLYAGKITYGDLAKFRAKQALDLQNNVASVVTALQAQHGEREKQQQEARARRTEAERAAQEQREAIERQQQFAQQQAQQQQEEARRQAALQFLMNRRPYQPYQLQPYQMPIQRSESTNCTAIGNQLNCTTR